ncbi:MAG: CRISPR-associated protein Cas4 [Chloroflexi bacterium RBG_16_57_11]|nr:MAG: CRISPR-associated protein Cas4 [Chloroflexi bacterium RBG_16_57_11]
MLTLALIIFIIALVLLWQAGRRQNTIGLPAGRVIYSDTHEWGPVEQPLYDAELGLVGKPDYLVESGGQLIPVEVKSTPVTTAPYDAHIFQLAAYCLLVQRHFGKRPAYGILHYPNRTFAIDYTAELEKQLLELLVEMHAQERRKELPRSHNSAARCSRCGFRGICNQRLL